MSGFILFILILANFTVWGSTPILREVAIATSLFSGSCLLYSYDPGLLTCNGGFKTDDFINILAISPIHSVDVD